MDRGTATPPQLLVATFLLNYYTMQRLNIAIAEVTW